MAANTASPRSHSDPPADDDDDDDPLMRTSQVRGTLNAAPLHSAQEVNIWVDLNGCFHFGRSHLDSHNCIIVIKIRIISFCKDNKCGNSDVVEKFTSQLEQVNSDTRNFTPAGSLTNSAVFFFSVSKIKYPLN